ncbi:MAG: glycosyltransferase family 4 protein [Verrucomicrobiota bacterium]
MRVTHVITRLIIGGAQENTLATGLGLRRLSGVSVQLLSGPTGGSEGSLEPVAAQVPGLLRRIPDLVRPVHPWRDLRAFRQLCRCFREWPPDIVHTHSGKAGILGRLAARRTGVPLIIHTIHGPSFGDFQGGLPNLLYRGAERLAGRTTTHFVSVADAMTCQYLAAGIGRPEQYTRIFSGFPLEAFLTARPDPVLRSQLGLRPGDFVVGKIARLFKLKGHEYLFNAAPAIIARCPRVKFLLVGDGPEREKFERRVVESRLQSHFIFTGLVPPERIPSLVGVMDALIHLSLREGLPRALPQALAAAKPVIAYDCDGAREVCLDGRTGLLLPPGTDVAEAVHTLAEDPGLCERLGRDGQAFVRTRFSVETMVADTYSLYQRLLAARPAKTR